MELIYTMRRKPLKCVPPRFESATDRDIVRPICTISSLNIIAFSSPTELADADGATWGGHVYVCDLDTPWDSHKVTSTDYPVSALEWDSEGKQLLVATTVGEVTVYGQKEFLLNEWTCLYSTTFSGEQIVKGVFFHNGRRILYVEKKADAPITDKVQVLRAAPTLKGFGGVACEGACVITATGLVCIVTPPPAPAAGTSPPRALVATEALRAQRDHVTHASFAHKNGNLLIAGVCVSGRAAGGGGGGGGGGWCVRCALCCVSRAPPPARPHLVLQPLPSVYLPDAAPPTSITWCLREDTDSVFVAGAALSLWKLSERAHPVHKLLSKGPVQGSTTPGGGQKPSTDCFNTVVWQQMALWPVDAGVGGGAAHVASCRLPVGAPHALLATPRALHLLSRDNHHYMCTRGVVTSGCGGAPEPPPGGPSPAAQGTPPKKTKYGAHLLPEGSPTAVVSCVELSHLGGVAVCVDSHAQLHVYRLPQPWAADIPTPLSVQHASAVLEYALVSGTDCLDVLMSLKPSRVEPVYERLTESFQRQPPAFQQYYYHSWLKLRIALCRLVPGGAGSVSALTCLQMLHAAWAASAAALRPDDKPDAAPLAALLDDHHADADKALLALEAKTEVSGEALALQALRRPLQRALDIAATAVAMVPHHPPHGYEVWSDPGGVLLLRKLCAVSRAAGVSASAGGDHALGRVLARLQQSAQAGAQPPKPDLLEECAAVSAQLAAPRVWEALPRCGVSAPHARPWPLYLEYGTEPEFLRFAAEPPASAQSDAAPSNTMDSIRYMYLGGGARVARWRQCARCGARALAHAQPARHPLQRAHDARFLPNCRCGGKWTLFSNF